jgi:hypothetical protein
MINIVTLRLYSFSISRISFSSFFAIISLMSFHQLDFDNTIDLVACHMSLSFHCLWHFDVLSLVLSTIFVLALGYHSTFIRKYKLLHSSNNKKKRVTVVLSQAYTHLTSRTQLSQSSSDYHDKYIKKSHHTIPIAPETISRRVSSLATFAFRQVSILSSYYREARNFIAISSDKKFLISSVYLFNIDVDVFITKNTYIFDIWYFYDLIILILDFIIENFLYNHLVL